MSNDSRKLWKPTESELLEYASAEELFLFANQSDFLAIANGVLELVQIKMQAAQSRHAEEREALVRDAERYRYIRADGFYVVPNGQYIPSVHGEALDTLIDAALLSDSGSQENPATPDGGLLPQPDGSTTMDWIDSNDKKRGSQE